MPTLSDELFSLVEKSILAAREAAEEAAQAALNTLAINRPTPYESMSEGARRLRRALRAKVRQLGGGSQIQGLQPLVEEIAYQQWHRMLFARFLAENDLLMHPTGVPVTLQDCAELAPDEGEADAWAMAAWYASEMLPGIFRRDDPVVQVRFAPEGRQELERILGELPQIVFQADDSLGWMYQFWQSKKKEEVNASERKIGGADLAPVTQLFTEDYMVRFLLENSLGAWWAARHPESPLIREWEYLRFKEDDEPAAGTFPGWPENVAEVTVMDPCCGSGHFLVAAFEMLRKMRMEEYGESASEAGDAVIRENIHGLELDLRATQIAIFSVALLSWKTGGYRELPLLNIACSGISVEGSLNNWIKLAGNENRLKRALAQMYQLFENAPTLGSLINPADVGKNDPMFTANHEEVEPLLGKARSQDGVPGDFTSILFGTLALDTVKAGRLLSKKFTLVITNVPYLTRNKQSETLREFIDDVYPSSKADLATVFIERCRDFTNTNGSYCLVTPQNWIFLGSYQAIREKLLRTQVWNHVSLLGSGSRATASWEKLRALTIITNKKDFQNKRISGLNAFFPTDDQKSDWLRNGDLLFNNQASMLKIPDSRIILEGIGAGKLLREYADAYQGIATSDKSRFVRRFWEIDRIMSKGSWSYFQTSFGITGDFYGRHNIVDLKHLEDWNSEFGAARIQGQIAWGKWGISVNQMRDLPVTIFTGDKFDANAHVIIPKEEKYLPAIYCFCQSDEYSEAVRKIDQKIGVTTATLVKVPFNLNHWQKVAEEKYPSGLPEPSYNDPTQWLFKGSPVDSAETLQVAVARLLGYRWPEQETNDLEAYADEDGIVCLTPVVGEAPAADRLRALLQAAYREAWSAQKQAELLAAVGFTGKTLRAWLRDGFFKQHVKLFKNRPFIWHIWDGRKDGFHALVNYHKLDAVTLDRLIYTYLGSWIKLQRDKRDLGEPGADGRLVAALELQEKLEAIREGEPPYDIYVRWKSLAEQPIGWNPDLNDGVRLNIRPFVTAGVLRRKFTVHWRKDRGKNPDGSERHNDLHYPIAEKRAARREAGQ